MKNIKWVRNLLLFVLVGCTTSRITHSWVSNTSTPKKYNKIMVVSILKNYDHSLAEKMEDHLVNDLNNSGFTAVSSFREYGPKEFNKSNEEAVIEKFKDSGIDAVMTIVLLNKSKERYYVPGHVQFSPYVVYHRRFWGYYVTMYDRVYSPGYYETDTKFFWESNLYDVTSKELIYSVQTQSFNPGSSESLAHEYGTLIVKDMMKTGLTPAKKGF